MTVIDKTSSIEDMAAHLNAKPTIGPDYLKPGAPILFDGGGSWACFTTR